ACDVHGKNHHRDGGFSSCVKRLRIALASGEIVECSAEAYSDLFWATVGGMGLTGAIVDVEFSLRPIETSFIKLHSIKSANLNETMALFDEHESNYQYSVAWLDCLATGSKLGRSILMLGNHACLSDLSTKQKINPLNVTSRRTMTVPFDLPNGLLNRQSISLFNSLYYAHHTSKHMHVVVDYDSFFYPLDGILEWNRLYGNKGFVQYQCVFPESESRQALESMLYLSSKCGWGSFLAVLKRFGPQEGLLSFPMSGYTITLDMPIRPGLMEFLNELDGIVLKHGGRVYLAKDARLTPGVFREMYPKLTRWLAVKSAVDPLNMFSSTMSERLQICPA
ncbi:MAG: FAD-binding oxidoreductase, partial [Candidatus Melainabacteria bacterium]|nr:FAD-binding oxidoreductase [Candidatus Melainabacteria bacterium]